MSGKGMSHVETLYTIKRQPHGPTESQIAYRLATSIENIWLAVTEDTGVSEAILRKQGWRAIKVVVQEV